MSIYEAVLDLPSEPETPEESDDDKCPTATRGIKPRSARVARDKSGDKNVCCTDG